jgi:cell division protein FtsZ
MKEMEEATQLIYEQAHEDANIIWGASVDESMGDMVKVTVIATGFDHASDEIVVEQESQRPTVISVPQQIATSRPATHVPPSRPAVTISEDLSSVRRRAPVPPRAPVTVTASRATTSAFPPASEFEWDVPAYTRRNGG